MAECSKNFKDARDSYLSKISLDSEKEAQLRTSRDALREKIRTNLLDKGVKDIRFYRQGSYAHRTLILPLDGDYDIDDGLYMDLTGFENEPSTTTIHSWIKEAVKGHTKIDPQDKEACIRAIFRAGYHVDLPAYKVEQRENDGDIYYLARKAAGWEKSNPRAMTDWFQAQVKKKSEQVRRLTKYFKGWKDFRNTRTSTKLPNGFTLTILVCEEYKSDIRDDISFHETARAILSRLKNNDEIWKPYGPRENMRDHLSDAQFDHFLKELENIEDIGAKALEDKSRVAAAKEWQKILGDRFPIIKDSDDENKPAGKKFEGPAIIGTTVKSA